MFHVLTWHDRDSFQCSENSECSQSRQVAHINEGCEVTGTDHNKVQPVPRVPQIRVIVQNESFGQHFDHHLCGVDTQEHIPNTLFCFY